VHSFEELEVWKETRTFRKVISELVRMFPSKEKFRLQDQILRSSRSVSANIAEGYGRFHHQENIQFCRVARGSLFETLDHLICAKDEKFITESQYSNYKEQFDLCLKLLNGYIAYLKKAKKNQ